MADIAETRPSLAPPRSSTGVLGWLRANLFSSWWNTVLTLLALWLLIEVVPPIVHWALIGAVWGGVDAEVCREATGACWAFVHEKYRLMLFGTYPYDEQWRPLVFVAGFIVLCAYSAIPTFWNRWLVAVWAFALVFFGVLMWGGVLGLTYVENTLWGGLPLTLILSGVGMLVAFPLAILMALGRRSNMPMIRALCVGYIELIRGVPLISILFMASFMLPLFLPTGVTIDKLLRAQVGMILFTAAYLAEAIRGGLQAIPRGQYEAADALGLPYWHKTLFIILPQALKITIPPMVNTFIGMFKDTSLVVIIGLFDLLLATRAAVSDPEWRRYFIEAYIFAAATYFVFCFTMSRYSQYLERYLHTGHKR
jgi:general L-amino acid transport system permease protein